MLWHLVAHSLTDPQNRSFERLFRCLIFINLLSYELLTFSFFIDGTFLYFHFPPCFASAAPRSRSDIFCSFPAIAAQLRDRSHENYPVCQKMTFSERKKHPLFVTVKPIYRYKTYYPGYFHNNIALLTLFHIVSQME